MFWEDKEINNFLYNEGNYKDDFIDCDYDDEEPEIEVHQMEIFQLRDNIIPNGLIPLEEFFDLDDVARMPGLMPTDKGVEDINLRTADKPKFVKFSMTLSHEVKSKYVRLLSEFSNVFSWDYLDLKVYKKDIIQHTIPIKPN